MCLFLSQSGPYTFGDPARKQAAAHLLIDDFARSWRSLGRRDARRPDSPLSHPGVCTHGEIRGRNDPASSRHGALNPDFHTNFKKMQQLRRTTYNVLFFIYKLIVVRTAASRSAFYILVYTGIYEIALVCCFRTPVKRSLVIRKTSWLPLLLPQLTHQRGLDSRLAWLLQLIIACLLYTSPSPRD